MVLFEQDEETGGLVPTEYAQELCEFAAIYDSNLRLMRIEFDRLRSREQDNVRVAFSLGALGMLGPTFIDEFYALHPRIRITFHESDDVLCASRLMEKEADLAVVVCPFDTGCDGTMLYECPMSFWMRTDDQLFLTSQKRPLEVSDLAGRDIAIPGKGFKCFDQLRERAGLFQVELGRIYELGEIFRIYEYAADGRALGFCNGTLSGLHVFTMDQEVCAVPVEGLTWGVGIERVQTRALSQAELAFWDWTVSYCKMRFPESFPEQEPSLL